MFVCVYKRSLQLNWEVYIHVYIIVYIYMHKKLQKFNVSLWRGSGGGREVKLKVYNMSSYVCLFVSL